MTPLDAIGYAFAALVVSPVVLAIVAGVVFVGFMLGLFVWESTKAQVALAVVGLIYGGTRLVIWNASRPPSPPESCSSRCEDYWEVNRVKCLQRCYESLKLIEQNEGTNAR